MTRTRTKDTRVPALFEELDYSPTGVPGVVQKFSSTAKASGELASITDTVTANYRKRRKKGEIIMNAVSLTNDVRTSVDVSWRFVEPTWGTRVFSGNVMATMASQNSPVYPSGMANTIAELNKESFIRALAAVSQSDADLLVTIGEGRETLKMLRHPFESAIRVLSKMSSRRAFYVSKGTDFSSAAAKVWLEYRLGWKPLLYDIHNIMNAYAKKVPVSPKPKVLVARGKADWEWSNPFSKNPVSLIGLTSGQLAGYHSRTVKSRSGVLYELTEGAEIEQANRRWGLRLSDVPVAFWELVPLSFVVDRFYNVGMWLQAITPKPGVKLLSNWTTTIIQDLNTHNCVEAVMDFGPGKRRVQTGGSYTEAIQKYDRVVNQSLPVSPSLVAKPLSFQQSLDHLALITSAIQTFSTKRK